jgi:D-alanyl-D-alanine carboxypeptidase/D-alanyl-D-alanine-endopeptidase (penicillin-binding protein 4)
VREQHRQRAPKRAVAVVALLLALVLIGGGLSWQRAGSGAFAGTEQVAGPRQDVQLPVARTAQAVLAEPSGGALSVSALRRRLMPLVTDRRFGRRVGLAVHDLTSDTAVLRVGDGAFMPASTLKLLIAAAALELLGPAHRFETVVTSSTQLRARSTPRLTLVGGGDPLLVGGQTTTEYPRSATLDRLIAATARALLDAGVRRVRVGYDDSLFSGPALSPTWEGDYVPDVTSPVTALSVDEGIDPLTGSHSIDPAALAARRFADGLRARGIDVGSQVTEAPAGAVEVTSEPSPPLDQVVGHVLGLSDNEGAELLLRHVGIAAGTGASFTGGATGVRAALRPLGVPWRGVRIADGSGLSRANRLPLDTLMATLELGTDDDHPELRAVVGGLPVAGFDGTLAGRYFARGTSAARGLVRAKTGTLTGSHALAGTVVDADGALLGFVAVANRVAVRHTLFARDQLDRIAAALAGCGCER